MGSFVRPYRWITFFLVITVVLPVTMELIVPRILRFVIDQGITQTDMNAIICGSGLMLTAVLSNAAPMMNYWHRGAFITNYT